ncbi:MAG: type IV pilus modification protein PilV [Deltaproteobacteria bacterium]|nr:type IV pilus modification protein PilV [Deltaproteobacteria bacterium]
MNNQKGFTLLEVLVAIGIVSVGLLAVASMQTTALQGNTSARDVTIAVQLAEEMLDRIRVNGGVTPVNYNGIDTNNNCATPVGLTDPVLGDCTQWRARLLDTTGLGLPGARGVVSVTADSPIAKTAAISVTITWGLLGTRTVTLSTVMETWAT